MASPPQPSTPVGRLFLAGMGCVGVLALGTILAVAVGYARIRGSAPYQEALQFAQHEESLAAVIGPATSIRWLPGSTRVHRTGADWSAELHFAASGERGTTEFVASCDREGALWQPCSFLLRRDGAWVAPTEAALPSTNPEQSALGTQTSLVRAQSLYDAERYRDAAAELDPVLEADPTHAGALKLRGRARAQTGDDVGATTDLEAAARLTPGDAETWRTLAWVRLHSGQDYEAISALNQYLALEPRDAKATNDRANAYMRIGELARALVDAKAACEAGYEGGCVTWERLRRLR